MASLAASSAWGSVARGLLSRSLSLAAPTASTTTGVWQRLGAAAALPTIALRLPLPSLADLLPPIVLAVPKSRTTHGKKRMRASNKGIKNKENIVACPVCKGPKLMHHVCPGCLARLERRRPDVIAKE